MKIHLAIFTFLIAVFSVTSCSSIRTSCNKEIVTFYKSYHPNSRGISFLYPAIARENKIEALITYSIITSASLKIETLSSQFFYKSENFKDEQKSKSEMFFRRKLHKHLSIYKPKTKSCISRVSFLYLMENTNVDKSKLKYDLLVEGDEVLLIETDSNCGE